MDQFNKHFLKGFEKQAGLAGAMGKFVGAVRKAPSAVGQAFQKAKQLPGQVASGVKNMRQQSAREFDVMQRRKLGPELRKSKGMASKPIDISKNVPKPAQVNGKTVYQKPAPKQPGAISRGLNHAKNVALVGTAAAGAGAYYGLKDPSPEQMQQREGYSH
jgi:hypothetical protein